MIDILIEKIKSKAPVVVGIDPNWDLIPEEIKTKASSNIHSDFYCNSLFEFGKGIIDAVSEFVPAVKFQMAYYELFGIEGLKALIQTVWYAKINQLYVIVDGKRNDIKESSEAYAKAYLSQTEASRDGNYFYADSLTVNPYFGIDGIQPFLDRCETFSKSIFVLVKTSNQSSVEFQDLRVDSEPFYLRVASKVNEWSQGREGKYGYADIGAVVGATYPETFLELRNLMKSNYFLIPGYGAQGGRLCLDKCFNQDGLGAVVSSSRSIIYAYLKHDCDFRKAAEKECKNMIETIFSS